MFFRVVVGCGEKREAWRAAGAYWNFAGGDWGAVAFVGRVAVLRCAVVVFGVGV
jgi:hypothetical protein